MRVLACYVLLPVRNNFVLADDRSAGEHQGGVMFRPIRGLLESIDWHVIRRRPSVEAAVDDNDFIDGFIPNNFGLYSLESPPSLSLPGHIIKFFEIFIFSFYDPDGRSIELSF